MGITTRDYMGILVVGLEEPLPTDDAGLDSFRDSLLALISDVPEPILVDLRQIKRMSSGQVQALFMAFLKVRSWACLAELPPTVLTTTQRPRTYPNEEEALRELRKRRRRSLGCVTLPMIWFIGYIAQGIVRAV